MRFAEAQLRHVDKKVNTQLSENVGGVNNTLGDIAEGIMSSDLFEKFNALGFDFDDAIPNCPIREKGTKKKLAELDLLMLNGSIAVAIEVKVKMTIGDVEKHIKRMKILHDHPNNLLKGKKLYGAMASVKMTDIARKYAIKKGLFVLEPSGGNVNIKAPKALSVW
jgi:hypothetical protein